MLNKLTMDIFEILSAMDKREEQIERKLQKIIASNMDPFPFERINKAKTLLKLIYEFKHHVKSDQLIEAGMRLRDLELEGLVILPMDAK